MSTRHVEALHFIDMSDGPRFAVVTHPDNAPSGTGVVLCSGGWFAGNWYFNRLYVDLARSLADRGHSVVRFDWFGSGESTGSLPRFRLDAPFWEDVVGAASLLEEVERIVGVGYCFGAASLLAAADKIDRLSAAVLVSAVVPGSGPRARAPRATAGTALRSAVKPSVMKGWLDPNSRRLYLKWLRLRFRAMMPRRPLPSSPRPGAETMATHIRGLTEKGVLVSLIYGQGDASLPALSREPLAAVTSSEKFRMDILAGDVEGSGTLQIQRDISQVITDVVAAVTPR